jgi:xanthine/CO dehydrogenase XdhC/CoxF family maturation factor
LERDVARNAWRWVEGGAQVVDFDTRADVFAPHGRYGTGCEGVITLLLQRMPSAGLDVLEVLERAQGAGEAVVVAHRYGGGCVGEQAVWWAGGVEVSGGFGVVVEAVERAAARVLEAGRSEGLELGDEGAFFMEYVAPPVELLIVGAGEDAGALVEVAGALGWRLRVASMDAVRLASARFEGVERHLLGRAEDVGGLRIGPGTRVVVMTHALAFDVAALPPLLASRASFVGLLGPTGRTARLMAALHERGALPTADALARLCAPVGLDLGADDAWEVAASIVAQIVARSHGRAGGALHGRGVSIHDPHILRMEAE